MAPPRGERAGTEGAWVKKGGVAGEDAGEEDGGERSDRKEQRGGRGRQSRERGGRGGRGAGELRDRDALAAEDGSASETRGRGRGARGGRGGRRGAAQEATDPDLGTALLTMLKASQPTVTRYTKEQLLYISQLKTSQVKPPDLSPLIDKENKDSQLLLRIAGASRGPDGEDRDPSMGLRKERRHDRRAERRGEKEDAEDAEANDAKMRRHQLREVGNSMNIAPTADSSIATAVSTPPASSRPLPATPPIGASASPAAVEKLPGGAKPGKSPTSSARATAPSDAGRTAALAGVSSAGPAADGVARPTASPGARVNLQSSSSLFSQGQTTSHAAAVGQAQALQAAVYMQAMNAAAAQAAAQGRGAYPGLSPWGYANPYLFPYAGVQGAAGAAAAAGAFPGLLDYSSLPQAGLLGLGAGGASNLEAVQQKLAAAAAQGLQQQMAQRRSTGKAGANPKAFASPAAGIALQGQGARAARQGASASGVRREAPALARPKPPGPVVAMPVGPVVPAKALASPVQATDMAAPAAHKIDVSAAASPSLAPRPAPKAAESGLSFTADAKDGDDEDADCSQS